MRRPTRKVRVGDLWMGGDAPVSVQSMTNTDTRDVQATLKQIRTLAEAGCEIIRAAVPDQEAAEALARIKAACPIPLVADIHFDYRLAIASIQSGADKVRINPGNLGGRDKLLKVAAEAKKRGVALRVGVNSGSLDKDLAEAYSGPFAEALAESALRSTGMLLEQGFTDIVVSLKSSSVLETVAAYRAFSQKSDLPLHLGVTEAGTCYAGTVKSAIGIGSLLLDGIGDTLRVSLTGDPLEEIKAGRQILRSLDMLSEGITFISCPTCGRCRVDLAGIAAEVEKRLEGSRKKLKVAIMGCEVNGPGEAREADVGLAGGNGCLMLFRKGLPVRRIPEKDAVTELLKEIEML